MERPGERDNVAHHGSLHGLCIPRPLDDGIYFRDVLLGLDDPVRKGSFPGRV